MVLFPWYHSICTKPSKKRTKTAVKNLRIVSSLLYFVARSYDPSLPDINVQNQNHEKDQDQDPVIKPNAVAPLEGVPPAELEEGKASAKISKEKENKTEKEMPLLDKLSTIIYNVIFNIKESDVTSELNQSYCESVLLNENRVGFDSLETLHNFLLPLEYFTSNESNKILFDEIMLELRKILNKWLSGICRYGLCKKLSLDKNV